MKYPTDDKEWAEYANDYALWLVENVDWPWNERQKRLWYIGVLAATHKRHFLETATIVQLQEAHRESIYK